MNKLNIQNGDFGDTPPIKEELETPIFREENQHTEPSNMNTLANINTILAAKKVVSTQLDNIAPDGYFLTAHYHIGHPVFTATKRSTDYAEEHATFEVINNELTLTENINFSGDTDEFLQLISKTLESEIPQPDQFGVIAGKYECYNGQQHENIKIADANLSFEEALARYAELESYPFCYIEYKGVRLAAFGSITEAAA